MSLTFHISGDMKTAELVGKQNKKLKYELQFTKSQNEKLKRDLEYQRRELVKRVKELEEQNSQAYVAPKNILAEKEEVRFISCFNVWRHPLSSHILF